MQLTSSLNVNTQLRKINGLNVVLKQSDEVYVSEFLPFKTFPFSLFLTAIDANSLSSLSYLTFFITIAFR